MTVVCAHEVPDTEVKISLDHIILFTPCPFHLVLKITHMESKRLIKDGRVNIIVWDDGKLGTSLGVPSAVGRTSATSTYIDTGNGGRNTRRLW